MSSPSHTNAIHLAQSLNAAQRASINPALRLSTLESQVRFLGALILVLVVLPDWVELAFAALLYWERHSKGAFDTPTGVAERKRVLELDALDASLRDAAARGDEELSRARLAEISGRLALAHGAAYTEPPLTDADRHLGATLAANDRLERLNAAISAQEAQIAWLQRLWFPCTVVVTLAGALAVFLAHHHGGTGLTFLASLWALLLLFGVGGGIPAHEDHLQSQLSGPQSQAAALRALLAEANGSTGAALMARWLTLRAQQEDELPLLSLVSEAADPGASRPVGVVA